MANCKVIAIANQKGGTVLEPRIFNHYELS